MSGISFQAIITELGTAFFSGRIDSILGHYAETLPMFLPETLVTFDGHGHLHEGLMEYRDQCRQAGVIQFRGKVVAQSLMRNGQSSVFVDWTHDFGPGRPPAISHAIYYFRVTGNRAVIEMIDYRHLTFKDAARWFERGPGATASIMRY